MFDKNIRENKASIKEKLAAYSRLIEENSVHDLNKAYRNANGVL